MRRLFVLAPLGLSILSGAAGLPAEAGSRWEERTGGGSARKSFSAVPGEPDSGMIHSRNAGALPASPRPSRATGDEGNPGTVLCRRKRARGGPRSRVSTLILFGTQISLLLTFVFCQPTLLYPASPPCSSCRVQQGLPARHAMQQQAGQEGGTGPISSLSGVCARVTHSKFPALTAEPSPVRWSEERLNQELLGAAAGFPPTRSRHEF